MFLSLDFLLSLQSSSVFSKSTSKNKESFIMLEIYESKPGVFEFWLVTGVDIKRWTINIVS